MVDCFLPFFLCCYTFLPSKEPANAGTRRKEFFWDDPHFLQKEAFRKRLLPRGRKALAHVFSEAIFMLLHSSMKHALPGLS